MNLLLTGCGKMGGALLERWQQTCPAGITHFDVIDPHGSEAHTDLTSLSSAYTPDVIVFAVKPQQLDALLPSYRERFGAGPLYMSVAAGKSLSFYRQHLGEDAKIVRVMPNTPALIGRGMSVLCAFAGLPETAKRTATQLMEAVGKAAWLDDESQMDAVTAISGCGPAYVFLFLETLVKAGIGAGLPEALAKILAVETLSGSSALAAASPETLSMLRQNVASPGGATEAALKVLMQGDALEKL